MRVFGKKNLVTWFESEVCSDLKRDGDLAFGRDCGRYHVTRSDVLSLLHATSKGNSFADNFDEDAIGQLAFQNMYDTVLDEAFQYLALGLAFALTGIGDVRLGRLRLGGPG